MTIVRFDLTDADRVRIQPGAYLGDAFRSYLSAVAGGKFDPSTKTHLASREVAARIAARVVALGWTCSGSAIDALRAEQRAAADAADATAGRAKTAVPALRPYQVRGAAWLGARRSALLADEMGLGKTIQVLASIAPSEGAIVVAPASVLGVWMSEARRWRPDLTPAIVRGRAALAAWPAPGHLTIVSYETIGKTPPAGAPAGPVVLVADEAHRLKGGRKVARVARYRALREAVLAAGGRSVALTGTPLAARPTDLWSVLESVSPEAAREAFGSWSQFVRLMGGREGDYGTEWTGPRDESVPGRLARVILRRTKSECGGDLPPKAWSSRVVDVEASDVRKAEDGIVRFSGGGLRDLQASVSFERMSAARAALAAAKIPAMLDVVAEYEEAETPVIVWSAHLAPLDALRSREGWAVIDGATPPERRTEIAARFQAGKLRGLACSIHAAGTGLTLTYASTAIFVDRAWNPSDNSQAEDRIHRIGQSAPVQIVDLVAEGSWLDERLAEILADKTAMIADSGLAGTVEETPEVEIPAAPAPAEAALRPGRRWAETEAEAGAIAALEAGSYRAQDADFARSLASQHASGGLSSKQWPFVVKLAALGAEVPREAETDAERAALEGLRSVSESDLDRASQRNDVGFSRMDQWLHGAIRSDVRTPSQWRTIVKMAHKYRRQIGL